MNQDQELEAFLARLYCEKEFLEAFLQDPLPLLQSTSLAAPQIESLLQIKPSRLLLAHQSYAMKRTSRSA